jgi:hypothetical protein
MSPYSSRQELIELGGLARERQLSKEGAGPDGGRLPHGSDRFASALISRLRRFDAITRRKR